MGAHPAAAASSVASAVATNASWSEKFGVAGASNWVQTDSHAVDSA
jgi:hypothetical protein